MAKSYPSPMPCSSAWDWSPRRVPAPSPRSKGATVILHVPRPSAPEPSHALLPARRLRQTGLRQTPFRQAQFRQARFEPGTFRPITVPPEQVRAKPTGSAQQSSAEPARPPEVPPDNAAGRAATAPAHSSHKPPPFPPPSLLHPRPKSNPHHLAETAHEVELHNPDPHLRRRDNPDRQRSFSSRENITLRQWRRPRQPRLPSLRQTSPTPAVAAPTAAQLRALPSPHQTTPEPSLPALRRFFRHRRRKSYAAVTPESPQ